MTFAEGLRAAFRGPQLQATLILLVATPLMPEIDM